MNFEQISDRCLYEMCQRYGLNAKLWLRKFGGLLPEVWRRKLWEKFRFHSIGEFASKIAGMGEETVLKILKLDERLVDKPLLRQKLVEGSQGWSKLQVVANIATPQTDKFWSEKVQSMSKPSLEKYVAHFRSSPGGDENTMGGADRQVVVVMHLSVRLATRLYKIKQSMEPVNWNSVVETLLEKEKPRDVVDVAIVKKSVSDQVPEHANSRAIPEKVKKVLELEFNGLCAFPRCGKPFRVRHHVKRFSLVPSHKPELIVPLCKVHHDLAHNGLIENEEEHPSTWTLRREPDRSSPKYRIDQKVQAHMRGS